MAREDLSRDQEVQASLRSLVESSEKWVGRLARRELRVRVASSLMVALVVFASTCWALVFYVSQGNLSSVLQRPDQIYPIVGATSLLGLLAGSAVYVSIRSRQRAELERLSSLIERMKRAGSVEGEAVTEDALSLTDEVFTLLPNLVRRGMDRDPVLFGVVAVAIALFGGNLAVAILVGVVVWLYFRYETRKNYAEGISKLEAQKGAFEKKKNDFLESL